MKKVILSLFLTSLVLLSSCSQTAPKEKITSALPEGVVMRNGQAYAKLANSREFALITLTGEEKAQLETLAKQQPTTMFTPMNVLPPSVDLAASQTAIRDQGWRNTCMIFANTAALEAAYKRQYGLDLDLSEEYFNHTYQMRRLAGGVVLPDNEVPAGGIDGGMGYDSMNLQVVYGMGGPLESTVPYHASPVSSPLLNWAVPHPQKDIDDFNLSLQNLPQAALEEASYRATGLELASGSDLSNITWFKNQLANQREVVFGFDYGGSRNASGVWIPGTTRSYFLHFVTLVGYDDAKNAFKIKNSWGGTSYDWMSYDWVTQSFVYQAYVIAGIASPYDPFTVWENKQLFLGQWSTNLDGWQGTLNIYMLPDAGSSGYRRIGTFFDGNGKGYRVNGSIQGNRLDFYIDPSDPNMPYNAQARGDRYTTYLFSWDHTSLAGSVKDQSGNTWAFHALKGSRLSGTANANSGGMSAKSYLGTWHLNHDGWHGWLKIDKASSYYRTLEGTYTDGNGQVIKVSGNINQDPRLVSFTIDFPGAAQTFNGFLHGWEQGLMSGTTTWQDIPFGFWAYRVDDSSDAGGDETPPMCRKKPYLPQCQ
jgi:Papain family cysteine protease